MMDQILSDNIRINLQLTFSNASAGDSLSAWAQRLIGRDDWWPSGDRQDLVTDLQQHEQTLVMAIIELARKMLELGRIPVFDRPHLMSIKKQSDAQRVYLIELELRLIAFIPPSAYQIVFKETISVCLWMANHSPTPEHCDHVYERLDQKVLNVLQSSIPSGSSTIPLLAAAHAMKIPYMHLGMGVYQLGWGSLARKLDRSICELDSAIGSRLVQHKVTAAKILRAAGLPAAMHGIASELQDALAIAKRLGFPVVVKPVDLDRGEGVTVDILHAEQLEQAFVEAKKLSNAKQVMIERQVSGVCHRLFVVNQRLLYAVKRHPISVIGDGKKTVKALLEISLAEQYQKPPWERSKIKPIDAIALDAISRAGYSLEAIPEAGVRVPLRRIESTAEGGVDEEVTSIVHPDNLEIALQAARLFGLHIAGIDIISTDIARPWHENGAIINEVNFAPLFGGGEISKAHIPDFLAEFIEGDGKIPVMFFKEASAALECQRDWLRQGKRAYFTSAVSTMDPTSREIVMPFKALKQRLRALTLRTEVDAIAVLDSSRPE